MIKKIEMARHRLRCDYLNCGAVKDLYIESDDDLLLLPEGWVDVPSRIPGQWDEATVLLCSDHAQHAGVLRLALYLLELKYNADGLPLGRT